MMILMMVFLFGFFEYDVSSIQCYTCNESGFFCSLPLNPDGGDESNENDIESLNYDFDYVCQSDHYFDSKTGLERIILRGTKQCEELDVINHRVYCCDTNNCNQWLPSMTIHILTDSNDQRHLPSIMLISFSVMFLCFCT